LGTIERERAYSTVHEGAIYLHLGESYRVVALDLVARSALVEPFTGDYYTQAKKETMTTIDETLRAERRLGLDLAFGRVSVTEHGFEAFEGWVEDTAKMLDGCPCESGCPSCVQSPKCGNLNEPLDKVGALELLTRMLRAPN